MIELGLADLAIGFLVKCLLFVLSFGVLRVVLRHLDNVVGINFKEWVDGIDDNSLAIYMGCRFIGAALLAGLIFS